MPVIDRDLASAELWERSLERSQRRRVLADSARKEIARRKTATYAVSAAVAASPMWPGITGTARELSGSEVHEQAKKLERRDKQRVLLEYGDESPAVGSLQKKLEIPEDGTYGPQTRTAVRDYQKSVGLDPTGEVDVRTWLKLFPGDMIVFAPPGSAKALGAKDAGGPQWAAVSAAGGDPAAALASVSNGGPKGGKGKSRGRVAAARAASIPGVGLPGLDDDTGGDIPDPSGTLPGLPGGDGPSGPPSPGNDGGDAPNGITPPAPSPSPPAPPSYPPLPELKGSVGEIIKTMLSAANRIDAKGYNYQWGGGHNMAFSGPYDCSGAVSAVLHSAGLLKRPMVSGELASWGAPGPGAVTIYANAGHVYMRIMGKYFGTTSQNPGGGAGWFNGAPRAGFAVRHVPFSALKLKDRAAEKRKKARQLRAKKRKLAKKRRAARRKAAARKHTGAPQQSQPAPQQSPPPQQDPSYPQPAPSPAPAPVAPAPAPAPAAPAPVQPAPVPPQQQTRQPSGPAPQSAPAPAPAPAPATGDPAAPAAPQGGAPVAPAPQPAAPQQSAPSAPAPQAPAPSGPPANPGSGSDTGQAPAPAQPSTPAPQAPAPPAQSAPAGDSAGPAPTAPPATAPKPAGGDSAGGDSGTAASG